MLKDTIPETADERPRLRVVRDEEAPPYDGQPPRVRRHMTVIADDVVERAFALGLAANGLYCYLERRVGKDGRWSSTIGEIAAAATQTNRHINDTLAALEKAELVKRETIYGRGGVPIGVSFFLPHHTQAQTPRTYDPELTPEPTPEPRARVDKGSSKSKTLSTAPPTYCADFLDFWANYPGRNGKKVGKAEASAVWTALSPEDRAAALAGVMVYAASDDVRRGFALDAVRWLKRRRWEDEAVATPTTEPTHDSAGRNLRTGWAGI